MKYLFFLIILIPFSISTKAQTNPDSLEVLIWSLENMPQFPGGYDSLNSFIRQNINWKKIKGCGEGRVFIKFIVDEEGTISEPEVVKGISKEFDNEAIRIFKLLPKWKPGLQNGMALKVQMVYPVRFSSL